MAACVHDFTFLDGASSCDARVCMGIEIEGSLRVIGTSTTSSARGRLEVFHSGRWGTVCDDGFDVADANVACRQMGYARGTSFTAGNGSGDIWMDDLRCGGSESDLASCTFSGWGVHNCSHSEDVGVECTR